MLHEVVIVDAVRTPIGRHGGALKSVRPDDLAAHVIRVLLDRTGIDPYQIEDVAFGCINQAGEDNRNVARMAALLADLPVEVAGVTLNRLCGSGMDALHYATRAIRLGDGDVFIAGGVESMTRAPWAMSKPEFAFQRGHREVFDTTLGWRFVNPKMRERHHPYSLGETAENIRERVANISRERQDEFSLESHRRAVAAIETGRFRDEIVPVEVPQRKGDPVIVDTDEHPRPDTSMEKLSRLRPAFRKGGTVTAGNSSGINDGAAAMLVMSAEKAKALGFQPMVRVVSMAVAGVDPAIMGMGPVPATRKALERAGLTLDDIDLIELNEAFAIQSLAVMDELDMNPAITNVNGGAVALGHPVGCSGARIMVTLVHEMRRRGSRYGLATMCIGVGQGIATIVERVEE